MRCSGRGEAPPNRLHATKDEDRSALSVWSVSRPASHSRRCALDRDRRQGRARVSRDLGHSAIFLALGRLEGSGCRRSRRWRGRCLTVGFTGDGGRSFATAENGLWCQPEDWIGCVERARRGAARGWIGTAGGSGWPRVWRQPGSTRSSRWNGNSSPSGNPRYQDDGGTQGDRLRGRPASGLKLLGRERYEAAVRWADHLCRHRPGDPRAHNQAGMARQRQIGRSPPSGFQRRGAAAGCGGGLGEHRQRHAPRRETPGALAAVSKGCDLPPGGAGSGRRSVWAC